MSAPKTHSVHRTYDSGGGHWITIKGHTRPYRTDEPLPEGASVVINGNRAVRAHHHEQGAA